MKVGSFEVRATSHELLTAGCCCSDAGIGRHMPIVSDCKLVVMYCTMMILA